MINDITTLRVGMKVHYQPTHSAADHWENGIIKEIREDTLNGVWVVYHCGGEWENYENYAGCLTCLTELCIGWKFR